MMAPPPMPGRIHMVIFVLACLAGLAFASVSTFDFAQHLDRQVHDLHCSFIPGQRTAAVEGEAVGCQVTLMSPYSSVLRTRIWGGLPISLAAMGVFAFLAFRGVDLLGRVGIARRRAAGWLFAFSFVPLAASAVMGAIALLELEAACKVCIGIYGASLVAVLAAGLGFASCRRLTDELETPTASAGNGAWALVGFAQLGAFVGVPTLAYIGMMPDYSRYVGTCGKLADTEDPGGVMVALDQNNAAAVAVEVFDPLCPACRAFDRRLAASGLDARIHRRAVLFPLDDTCNWMVEGAVHPGACTLSEAILCADGAKGPGPTSKMVIDWAFEAQDAVRAAAKTDPTAARRMVVERFPELSACVGSAEVQQRLNKSLRWAVSHSIPVLTPQLYVNGVKLCPEDTDLGLEYSLTGLLERRGAP
jgi:Vitamin K epoxide reductase family